MPLRQLLIVDRDPTAALVTQRGLQRMLNEVVEVSVAPSPEAAWSHCLDNQTDLLIVDPHPQNEEASGLIRAVRAYCPMLPVLVLTAYDTPRLRSQMRAIGVRYYLAKPVDLFELTAMVRQIFDLSEPVAANASPSLPLMGARSLATLLKLVPDL